MRKIFCPIEPEVYLFFFFLILNLLATKAVLLNSQLVSDFKGQLQMFRYDCIRNNLTQVGPELHALHTLTKNGIWVLARAENKIKDCFRDLWQE